MKYELTAPMYILFIRLADYMDIGSEDVEETLDNFLIENINIDKGISKKYILNILRQAIKKGEACNIKLEDQDVIKRCKKWIKRNREENTIDAEITVFKPESFNKRKNSKPEFSHAYIALKCFYKGIAITDKNAERIAKIYGYVAPYSGIKLKRNYEHYRSIQNRTNSPGTKKFKNMVNDLESIIKDLPQKKWKHGNPIKELDELRKNSEQ